MQDSRRHIQLHIVSQYLKQNEIKARLLRLLAVGFRFCKKLDVTIIISINEIRVDAHVGIAFMCF